MTTAARARARPTEDRFFTPRRPIAADVAGDDAVQLLAWHSEVTPPSSGEFHARMSLVVFDSMALVRIRHSAAQVHRTPELVESLSVGSTLYFVLSGSMAVRQAGRSLDVAAGSAVVLSGHLPFELECAHPVDLVIVVLRRHALDGRGVPDSETDIRVLPESGYLMAVTSFLAAVSSDPPRPASTEGVTAQQAVLHLLTGVLSATDRDGLSRRAPRADDWHARALGFIAANHSDPRLSTADVAEATGISERHLQRVLAGAGTSVALELRRSRLRWAVAVLARRPPVSIDEIALITGFGTSARMRRAFLAEHGVTPAHYRSVPPEEGAASLAR